MNKKVKELAEQADLQFVVKTNDDNEDVECVESDNGYPTAEQFEKFSELIVRECMAQCRLTEESDRIRSHFFGVE